MKSNFEKKIESLFEDSPVDLNKKPFQDEPTRANLFSDQRILPEIDSLFEQSKSELEEGGESFSAPIKDKESVTPALNRKFVRSDIPEGEIELKFSDERHFAIQYIENLSLGGLFVKTQAKRVKGELLPIRFSLPGDGCDERHFDLMARVARVTDQGLGLEFTNLQGEKQADLEQYIRSVLPEGVGVRESVKQSTLDRLAHQREQEETTKKKRVSGAKKLALVLVLFIFNAYLGFNSLEVFQKEKSGLYEGAHLKINGRVFKQEEIKAVRLTESGQLELSLRGSQAVLVDSSTDLPYHLRQSLKLVKSFPKAKVKRRSRNSNLVRQTK